MLWINYLDTGSERVHTSLEGSFRMEGWRGGGDEEEEHREKKAGFKKRFTELPSSTSERQGSTSGLKSCLLWRFHLYSSVGRALFQAHTSHLGAAAQYDHTLQLVSSERPSRGGDGGWRIILSSLTLRFSQDLGNEAVESVSLSRFDH